MKAHLIITLVILVAGFELHAQSIGIGTTTPDTSAVLDVNSTTQGILIPRMTSAQREAIASPATGLFVYQTGGNGGFYFYNGSTWLSLNDNNYINSTLSDTDGDTKIQVEKTLDDDTIRFDIAGTERFKMSRGRLEFIASGNSVFIGDNAGINDEFTNNRNVGVGSNALKNNASGIVNTAIGHNTLDANTTGSKNNAQGSNALGNNTTGEGNTGFGHFANYANIDGTFNTGIGFQAGVHSTTPSLTNATAIGANAKVAQDSSLILGDFADVGIGTSKPDAKLHVVGSVKIEDGTQGAGKVLMSDANGRAGWEELSLEELSDADGDTKIQVEESPDEDTIRFDIKGKEYFKMSKGRLEVLNTDESVYIGEAAGASYMTAARENVAIGGNALDTMTSGRYNAAVGNDALGSLTTAYNNVALGQNALGNTTTGNSNVGVGYGANESNIDGEFNTAFGYNAGVDPLTPGLINATAIGANAKVSQDSSLILGDNAKVGIGTNSPNADLHIVGSLLIEDGTQGEDKVLVSNANGLASWLDLASKVEYDFIGPVQIFDNSDDWEEVAKVTMNVNNGASYKIEGNMSLRLSEGSGYDEFFIKVIIACGTSSYTSNVTSYAPPESSNDHDNFLIIPYLDSYEPVCPSVSNSVTFSLNVRNAGNDAWEAQDVILMVTEY